LLSILRGVMSYTNKYAYILFILVLTFGLNACGFHLRGSGTLRPEIKQVFIDEEYLQTEFGRKLRQALLARGANVVGKKETATAVLKLSEPVNTRRLLSVNELAQARDYILASKLRFSLSLSEGKNLMAEQTVEVRRELVADPNNILGTDQEAQRLYTEMQQELVQALLMRLRSR